MSSQELSYPFYKSRYIQFSNLSEVINGHGNRTQVTLFSFLYSACIMLNGSNDKPDTTEQRKCDVISSEARRAQVQIYLFQF